MTNLGPRATPGSGSLRAALDRWLRRVFGHWYIDTIGGASENERLRLEASAARSSCSAEAKRGNRYLRRIHVLEGAIVKHKGQAMHDQAYIDSLERLLTAEQIQWAKDEVTPF